MMEQLYFEEVLDNLLHGSTVENARIIVKYYVYLKMQLYIVGTLK